MDSAMVEKKEVRRGGRLLLLREVLKRLGDCCTRPPVEVYRGEFEVAGKVRFHSLNMDS